MNRLKEQFKKSASVNGSYSVGAIVLVLCVVVLVNYVGVQTSGKCAEGLCQ